MPRLLVHVEGQTEEDFVNEVLRAHLIQSGYSDVAARLAGNPRLRSRRGGIRSWDSVRRDVLRHLRQDAGAVAALMVDYYGLPQQWPGRAEAPLESTAPAKAEHVESGLMGDISHQMGAEFDPRRFVPLVMVHEFEALLFSDPERFAEAIGMGNLAGKLHLIRSQFETPEEINDSVETAPSQRILSLFPRYEKPLFGVFAVLEIGLTRIRQECPHFNSWLASLESLPREVAYLR